jgi:hypothetical protein
VPSFAREFESVAQSISKYFLTRPKRLGILPSLLILIIIAGEELVYMKISEQTLKMINQLPRDMRSKVDRVVRTHVQACMKTGSPVENFDRLLIEAVEIVKLEERAPETRLEYSAEWEPHRHYDQYISPREL